jgi:hypothetical protein
MTKIMRAARSRKSLDLLTPHLTSVDPRLDSMVRDTRPGMAHWGHSGPPGTTCGQCKHFGYSAPLRNGHGETVGAKGFPKSCHLFFTLMRQHGRPLPPSQASCRHFEPKKSGLGDARA